MTENEYKKADYNNTIEKSTQTTASGSPVVLQANYQYEGPIPPAFELDRYEKVEKGMAGRIIAMAEHEQKNRHESRRLLQSHNIVRSYLGLIFGFIIICALSGMGFYLLVIGKSIEGFVLLVGSIGTLLLGYIYGPTVAKEKKVGEEGKG
ncbi:MAG: DUF2335 domain-containing protein [bacterium]